MCPGSGDYHGITSEFSEGIEHPSICYNDTVSPDAISLSYYFSHKKPPPVSAAGLLQARSTPETLQLPPRPAASLPGYGGLAVANTCTEDVVCCSANPKISSHGAFPEEMVSQHNLSVRKFNHIQLKFSLLT